MTSRAALDGGGEQQYSEMQSPAGQGPSAANTHTGGRPLSSGTEALADDLLAATSGASRLSDGGAVDDLLGLPGRAARYSVEDATALPSLSEAHRHHGHGHGHGDAMAHSQGTRAMAFGEVPLSSGPSPTAAGARRVGGSADLAPVTAPRGSSSPPAESTGTGMIAPAGASDAGAGAGGTGLGATGAAGGDSKADASASASASAGGNGSSGPDGAGTAGAEADTTGKQKQPSARTSNARTDRIESDAQKLGTGQHGMEQPSFWEGLLLRLCAGRAEAEARRKKRAEELADFRLVTAAVVRSVDNAETSGLSYSQLVELRARQARQKLQGADRFVILPHSQYKHAWDLFVIMLVLYNAVALPMDAAFNNRAGDAWSAAETVVDFLFAFDMLLSFRLAFEDDITGRVVTSSFHMAKRYLEGWFTIDLLAILPFEAIAFAFVDDTGSDGDLLRYAAILKCLRLLRLGRLLRYLDNLPYANAFRLIKLVSLFVMCTHWCGCAWHWLAELQGQENDRVWTHKWGIVGGGVDVATKYAASLYAGLCMLVGENLDPETTEERVFAFFAMLFGACMTASLFGQVAIVLQSMGARESAFRAQMDMVNANMRLLNVPPELQVRIRNYYDYVHHRHKNLDRKAFYGSLSEALGSEVCLYLHREMVQKVPFFRHCDADFLVELVRTLAPRVYMPGDFIVRFGEFGSEMYFLVAGEVEVMTSERNVVATLGQGNYFGELAILKRKRRTASVRAKNYCDLNVLSRDDLTRLLEAYPEMRGKMQAMADSRMNKFALSLRATQKAKKVALKLLGRMRSKRDTKASDKDGVTAFSTSDAGHSDDVDETRKRRRRRRRRHRSRSRRGGGGRDGKPPGTADSVPSTASSKHLDGAADHGLQRAGTSDSRPVTSESQRQRRSNRVAAAPMDSVRSGDGSDTSVADALERQISKRSSSRRQQGGRRSIVKLDAGDKEGVTVVSTALGESGRHVRVDADSSGEDSYSDGEAVSGDDLSGSGSESYTDDDDDGHGRRRSTVDADVAVLMASALRSLEVKLTAVSKNVDAMSTAIKDGVLTRLERVEHAVMD